MIMIITGVITLVIGYMILHLEIDFRRWKRKNKHALYKSAERLARKRKNSAG